MQTCRTRQRQAFRGGALSVHVRDVGLESASDEKILRCAVRSRAVLVTRDLDFANVILHPPRTHYGVVVLRTPSHFTARHLNSLLRVFLSRERTERLTRRLTILEPGRYRTRS